MSKITRIRNRIGKVEKKNKVLTFLSILMIGLSLVLGVMIYAKKDENGAFLKENFNISVNFKTFNSKVNTIVNDLFEFDLSANDKKDEMVSSPVMYIELGNDMYSSDSSSVSMLHNGTVLGVYEDDYSYSILINYENGVLASYSNLIEVNVKQYDELNKGDLFGTYEESFKVLFKKDNVIISYDEAI